MRALEATHLASLTLPRSVPGQKAAAAVFCASDQWTPCHVNGRYDAGGQPGVDDKQWKMDMVTIGSFDTVVVSCYLAAALDCFSLV